MPQSTFARRCCYLARAAGGRVSEGLVVIIEQLKSMQAIPETILIEKTVLQEKAKQKLMPVLVNQLVTSGCLWIRRGDTQRLEDARCWMRMGIL